MQPEASDDIHTHVVRARPWGTTRPGWRALRARRTVPPVWNTPAHGARRTRSSLVLGALVLAAVVSTRWVRLNVSPSVPVGLYRLERLAPPLARGTLVILSPPASIHPWWRSLASLLKPVAAVAGEEVCGVEGTLFIHGEAYGLIYTEADGKPLPHLDGCQVVPEGAVFLASTQPKSLDSRYFGMTPIATLTARAVPLWTWR